MIRSTCFIHFLESLLFCGADLLIKLGFFSTFLEDHLRGTKKQTILAQVKWVRPIAPFGFYSALNISSDLLSNLLFHCIQKELKMLHLLLD